MFTYFRSVRACKDGTSVRNYDCEYCEHYGIDCDFSDTVQLAIKTGDFSNLPELVQEQLIIKTSTIDSVDTQQNSNSWKSKLDPKRLP